ncbi:hypothetical protein GP5015_112 [gamma proteobacterium HTCC5015]|nr:hypothetical protein GP5015_112 [gamma proteobacterium HTCC5015]
MSLEVFFVAGGSEKHHGIDLHLDTRSARMLDCIRLKVNEYES